MSVKFSNNATTELASSIGTSDTSITVVDGSKFPILTAGDYTYVTLDTDTASPTREIVRVTAIAGNVLTVTRGQDGTSPASFAAGTKVELRLTAALLNDVAGANPSGEPIGFPDKSQTTITFDSGIRTFSITPTGASFDVYCKGVKYTYTTVQLVTIPNTTGLHFIYFSASGVLSTQMSYFTWEEHAPTAYVYWNATTQQAIYFGDERHGITLDWQTHEYLHRTRGAAIANGFAASGYTTTGLGATDADAQIDIGGGTFFDEDMQVDIVSTNTPVAGTWQQDLSGPARIPVMYLSGTAWVIDSPTNFPFKVVSSVPQYNLLSGSTWSTASVTNNSYFVSWILATNNLTYPVISIISQAPTNQLSVAEAMTFEGLNLNGFPSVEFRPLYKVIYQYKDGFANSVKSSTIAVYDLRSISSAGVAAALVQDHGNLSGLTDDDHPQYVHTSEVRTPSAAVKNSFFPSQVGQTGKYLSTDGTNAVWEPAPSGSLNFTGDVTGTGSTGSSTTLTLAASGVVAGQYTKVTVDAKGRVTAGTSVTSSDVTTALGYTPYNATNPAGYTTNVGTVTSVSGTGTVSGLTLTGSVTSSGSLTLGGTLSLTSGQVTSALGFTPYNATNPSGYITGITSGMVTTALGYTPYNSSNPSGYITSSSLSSYLPLSGGTVTGNLFVTGTIRSTSGVFQLNDGASTGGGLYFYKTITGSGTSLAPSLFAETGLPLYFMNNGSATPKMTLNTSGELIVTSKVYVGGATVNSGYNGIYGTNMVGAASGNKLVYFFNDGTTLKVDAYDYGTSSPLGFTIGGNGGTVNLYTGATVSGNAILHAGNYNDYAPSKTGTGASGTWGISITGNAATATTASNSTNLGGNASSYYDHRAYNVANNYLGAYYVGSGTEKPNDTIFGAGKLKLAMLSGGNLGFGGSWNDVLWMSSYTGGDVKPSYAIVGDKYSDELWFSRQNYDSATWGTGRRILHSGNFSSYVLPLSGGTLTGTLTGTTGRFQKNQTAGDYTTAALWTESYGNTATGVAFHISGNVGKFLEMRTNGILYWNGDTVIHSGNYSSYALPLSGGTVSGNTTFTTSLTANTGITVNAASSSGYGINLYSGSSYQPTYGLFFATTGNFGTYGAVSGDWATYFTMSSDSGRGWVFRNGSGNVAAISNQGNMTLNSHFEQGNNIARPNVSWSASSNSTGMVIFYLPGTTANYGMVHMVFDIYEYNSNAVSTVIVGGHNWSTSWYNTGCSVIGQCGKSVRLGVKDGRFCVVFGTSGSSWEYGTIVLRKIHNGSFYDNIMNMVGDWSATQTATESFTNITGDLRNLRTPSSLEVGTIGYAYQSFRSPIFYDYDNTGYYFDGASTSNFNQLQTDRTYGFTDIRSPIFYDYNNTGYYVDPASTSILSTVLIAGTIRNNGSVSDDDNFGLYFDSAASTSYAIYREPGSWTHPYPDLRIAFHTGIKIGANSSYQGVRFYTDYDMSSQVMSVNNGSDPLGGGNVYVNNNLQAGSSLRAPIFYDSDNTGYYLDPLGTSELNRINTVRTNNWLYIDQNYGHSVVGVYTSVRYQGVWAMGDSYKLPADGTTTGNLYGLAWSHPNTGGVAANLASHGLLLLEAGSFKGAWGGGSFRTPGDVRGTIFYDYDNTGYYLDPTSTTSLRTVGDWRADSASWTGEFSGKIQYHSSIWYFQAATGWQFRNSAGSQMMFCDSGGNVTFNGNVTAYSDRRLKDNVRDLTGAKAYLDKISAKRFTWKDDGYEDIGFIAQDVEAAGLTEFVLETADYDPNTGSTSDPVKTLDYGRMVSVLWQAVKEQNIQITAMSAEINSLKERLH